MPRLKLDDIIAPPGFAPRDWQSRAPDSLYEGTRPAVEDSEDLRRVLALPLRPAIEAGSSEADALIDHVNNAFRNGRAEGAGCRCSALKRECVMSLLTVQARALYEISQEKGLFGPIGVGHGKTFLDILAPLAMPDCRLALLLIPSTLAKQFTLDYELLSQHFHVPGIVMHGITYNNPLHGRPTLHVLPYSRLQLPSATAFIRQLAPDFIIADETHKLSSRTTATCSRVMRYIAENPGTRFACWSGSITNGSLEHMAHLGALALRERSPMPIDPEVVKSWASAIDSGTSRAPMGALQRLCTRPGQSVENAFFHRLVETPGVVATTVAAVGSALDISERKPPKLPPIIEEALNSVRNHVRPDWIAGGGLREGQGEILADPLAQSRCAREVACGFFYRWKFPRGESRDTIDNWIERRKEWRSELRSAMYVRKEHMDSEWLCEQAAMRGCGLLAEVDGLPTWHASYYRAWFDVKNDVQPQTEAIRIHDFVARDAAEWALENRGVVWYDKREFGLWIAQISGLSLHTGGKNADAIVQHDGSKSIIASIQSHGTGRNGLQYLYHDQLVANPPSNPAAWEQLLGRLHRQGQRAPVVYGRFYRHTEEMKKYVDRALRKALNVQETIGAAQKIHMGYEWADDGEDF